MPEVRVLSSKLVKPAASTNHGAGSAVDYIPLTVFDRVTYEMQMAVIYAFAAPAPSTAALETGLAAALAQHRLLAGQLVRDGGGAPAVLLNDHGVRVVEASVDGGDLADMVAPARQPRPELLALHPDLEQQRMDELVSLQLTRFRCGSLALGFTINHAVADGRSLSSFLAAWGRATRGLAMGLPPVYHHHGEHAALFKPRPVPRVLFDHRSREYYLPPSPAATTNIVSSSSIVVHKAHFPEEWIARLRASASKGRAGGGLPQFSRFEAILAHLWRAITFARGLHPDETSTIRVSVDGRDRLGVPAEYFGNLILWAFPTATVGDLQSRPLRHAAQVIHDEVARVADASYFRSFVDFAGSGAVEEEGLAPTAALNMRQVLCPDLEVHSWLTFPYYDLDFGTGNPTCFMPSYFPQEGLLFFVPCLGDGSVDAFVTLFHHNLQAFKQCCYPISISMQHRARI